MITSFRFARHATVVSSLLVAALGTSIGLQQRHVAIQWRELEQNGARAAAKEAQRQRDALSVVTREKAALQSRLDELSAEKAAHGDRGEELRVLSSRAADVQSRLDGCTGASEAAWSPACLVAALSGGSIAGAQWEAALERAQRSVIRVRNRTCDGVATGSGFVYDRRTLVTNAHVVEGAKRLTLDTVDGRSLDVVVAQTATDEDIALVRTTATLPSSLPLAAKDAVPGDLVRALGFPLGGRFQSTQGRVIDLADGAEYEKGVPVLRSSVAIRPGNSGGPLINASGRVVGVLFAIDTMNGHALVIPVSRLRQVVNARLAAVKTTCSK